MNKVYLSLLSLASLSLVNVANATDAPATQPQQASSQFNPEQVAEIKKIITEYVVSNPTVIMASFQAGMLEQQKAELVKVEKAVTENKDKIFKNANAPTAGNANGTQSLVVFMDPYCGYCKKFHGELAAITNANKDLKVTFVDIPIMGPNSIVAVKAMLAAKAQGKYEQLQKAIFTADKHLTKKQILKVAESLGIDKKKLEADMKSKDLLAQIDSNANLAKTLGINGTPTLIIGETKVVPGFVNAEEVNKLLKEKAAPAPTAAEAKPTPEKTS